MTTRRSHGEGSLYYSDEKDLWIGQADLGAGPDGKRRRPKVTGRTKTEARRKLIELQRQAADGIEVNSTDRLGPFVDWWIGTLEAKAASGSKSVNTVDNAAGCMRKWVVPTLGSKKLRDLTPENVESLLAHMVAEGKARRTVSRMRSYLGQALAVAERRGKVSRNVARLAEMPETVAPTERRALSPEQAERLLEAAQGDRLEALYLVGLMTALRPGELTGLRWVDVNLDTGRMVVDGSMKIERGKLRLGATKTSRSRRSLTIPAPVVVALRSHRKHQIEEHLLVGGAWQDSGLVFTTTIGGPIDPANLRRSFRSLTASAGLEGHWTPNELRHSAATLLYESGVGLEQIADLLGHTSTRMLEQHYRHHTERSLDCHIEVMERMFGS